MKRLLFVILLITISFLAKSKDDQAFKPVVDNINNLFTEIINARTDTDKEKINSELIGAVNDFLHKQGSFDHAIDTLKHLSCLKSSDNALRIYTWNLCYTDGSFKYFGFVQQKAGGKLMYIACRTVATKILTLTTKTLNTIPPPNGTDAYTTNA